MIMNLSGGGKPHNVLVVYVKEADATITVTNGVKTLTNITDSAGYAYFTNLDIGTWTISAVSSLNHPAPSTPTVTIIATQISYYVAFGFEFWLYDNSYADVTLNECKANSGGWAGTIQEPRTASSLDTKWSGGGTMHAENLFDLSNYNMVSALVTKNANALIDKLQVRASNKTTVLAEAQLGFVATEQWVTIDISAITAQGYIYLTANTNDIISMRKCYLA